MKVDIPNWLTRWIEISDSPCEIKLTEEKSNDGRRIARIDVTWNNSPTEVSQMQLDMKLTNSDIECVWKPHLSPQEDMLIGDLVFRSPAIILEKDKDMFALVPDIDFINDNRDAPQVMDYVKDENLLFYGLGHYEKTKHVYHKRVDKPIFLEQGKSLFRFYLIEWKDVGNGRNFKPVVEFLWEKFAKGKMAVTSSLDDLEIYVKYAYDWAFERWENVVWQDFKINQQEVGGCVFIVRAAQSPGFGQEDNWRERKSLWNQAWFSSLRSAYGYRLWGEKWGNEDLKQRAEKAKRFALSAPQMNGLFPSVYWADSEHEWEYGHWGHSDRRPVDHEQYGHLLDMSWTCLWMLKWYRDIEKDEELLTYTKNYAERLLRLQDTDGSFPGWVHEETGEISSYLNNSPESSMHVWMLTQLYSMTKDIRYLESAQRGMEFLLTQVIPEGRWEDFELYWSCAREWEEKQYGQKDKRSGLYNQCSFSIYWTAEALKELYLAIGNQSYLQEGEKVLAELSLYQAIWNPDYLQVPMLGGFGVMTSDDEWNDARQSLFALTYLDYFKLTGRLEYKYRGIWAIRASFYLMYCPENTIVKEQYEKTFPHFSEKDYGFEMENAHHGENDQFRTGEFTIFDWGNGSAAASLGEILFRREIN